MLMKFIPVNKIITLGEVYQDRDANFSREHHCVEGHNSLEVHHIGEVHYSKVVHIIGEVHHSIEVNHSGAGSVS